MSSSTPPPEGEEPLRERGSPVRRTGLLLFALIACCFAMGFAIWWLVHSGRH